MDDEIPPIQAVVPTPAVSRVRPVPEFRRRLGLHLQRIAQRMRNAPGRANEAAPDVEPPQNDPEEPPPSDPTGQFDAKA